jgi:DNA modification methylase
MPAGRGEPEFLGWTQTCRCLSYPTPVTVLDPFAGSGTVGAVASALRRHSLLIEQSSEYVDIARRRLTDAGAVLV